MSEPSRPIKGAQTETSVRDPMLQPPPDDNPPALLYRVCLLLDGGHPVAIGRTHAEARERLLRTLAEHPDELDPVTGTPEYHLTVADRAEPAELLTRAAKDIRALLLCLGWDAAALPAWVTP